MDLWLSTMGQSFLTVRFWVQDFFFLHGSYLDGPAKIIAYVPRWPGTLRLCPPIKKLSFQTAPLIYGCGKKTDSIAFVESMIAACCIFFWCQGEQTESCPQGFRVQRVLSILVMNNSFHWTAGPPAVHFEARQIPESILHDRQQEARNICCI